GPLPSLLSHYGVPPVSCSHSAYRPHFFFLFLHPPGDIDDLLSFPTRRSSDLPALPPRPQARMARRSPPKHSLPLADPDHRRRARSEEHTSELQSPDHLVCRLLLEKKKQGG